MLSFEGIIFLILFFYLGIVIVSEDWWRSWGNCVIYEFFVNIFNKRIILFGSYLYEI